MDGVILLRRPMIDLKEKMGNLRLNYIDALIFLSEDESGHCFLFFLMSCIETREILLAQPCIIVNRCKI